MCYLNYSGNFYFITWVMMIVMNVIGMVIVMNVIGMMMSMVVIILFVLINFISCTMILAFISLFYYNVVFLDHSYTTTDGWAKVC